jgi:hypothetical protein
VNSRTALWDAATMYAPLFDRSEYRVTVAIRLPPQLHRTGPSAAFCTPNGAGGRGCTPSMFYLLVHLMMLFFAFSSMVSSINRDDELPLLFHQSILRGVGTLLVHIDVFSELDAYL